MAMAVLSGIGVCPGLAVGPVVLMPDPIPEPSTGPEPADRAAEVARIAPAMESVAASLRSRAAAAGGETKAVLEATVLMATDPGLAVMAEGYVRDRGLPAARAVYEAANTFRDMLAAAGGYIGARAADVEDVRDRVVATLLELPIPGVPDVGHAFVLAARDLAPADTATVHPDTVLGFVTEEGGPTSHTAILARVLGIPAVVSCAGALDVAEGTVAVLDGAAGTVDTEPDEAARAMATERMVARRAESTVWSGKGATADGMRIQLLANVGDPASARAAAAAGAEGVGLFRTEFLFLDAVSEPSLEQQRTAYTQVFAAFTGRKVVLRTLDAGADKPLAFLDQRTEPNPALGVRGLRVGRERPEILDRQLAAVGAAARDSGTEVWVMAPMVALPEEAAWFAERVLAHGLPTPGVMVEVPSAALLAPEILDVVDFISIGTNDLAQYTLAADRMAGPLAALNDPWQPALLRLVERAGAAGMESGKPVGVCGEAAADPLLALVLVGLGVTSLSMAARAIPDVGEMLAKVSRDECAALGELAVTAPDAATARARVSAQMLGGRPLG
jgi:phosphotransferase system enzyme I (PtsI)